MDKLSGYIERITFHNSDNGFTVAKLKTSLVEEPIAVIGIMLDVQPGESLECTGSWKNDPKHGR